MREASTLAIAVLTGLSILLIHGLVASATTNQACGDGPTGTVAIRVYIEGNITNLGSSPLYIDETDLLVFDYPIETSDQSVLSYAAYINGKRVPQNLIAINVTEDYGRLYINASCLNTTSIEPGETVGSAVEYVVSIDMASRRNVLSLIQSEKPGGWSNIDVKDRALTRSTRLWNYTNPLVSLLASYIRSEHNETPYDYMLGALEWIDHHVTYSTRIPPRQPWEVIAERKGDCDDQSNLFITLLRAAGIPSYLEMGLVYLSPTYRASGSSSNGFFKYTMIGGGGHGWSVAYIPPWGFIRVDLTFGSSSGNPVNHILYAAYYNFPTVVLSRFKGGSDYASSSAEYMSQLQERRILEEILLVLEKVSG